MYLHNARYAVNTIYQVDDTQHQLYARKPPIGYVMVRGYDVLRVIYVHCPLQVVYTAFVNMNTCRISSPGHLVIYMAQYLELDM